MAIIRDTLRPELERIKTELKALQALKIHVGIQGDADSYLLMIAGVHEYGATIRAKNVKTLAIPISREAEGKSPRDFQGLFFITSEEGHLFGVTDKGNGKFNFLFLLLPSVTIPERSFIRGSFDHGKNELAEACKAAIDKIVLEGGTAREAAALIGERAAAMTQAYIMKGIDPPKSSITMETTKSGKRYAVGYITNAIEGGHRISKPRGGKNYTSRVQVAAVPGLWFYDAVRQGLPNMAQGEISDLLEIITAGLEGRL